MLFLSIFPARISSHGRRSVVPRALRARVSVGRASDTDRLWDSDGYHGGRRLPQKSSVRVFALFLLACASCRGQAIAPDASSPTPVPFTVTVPADSSSTSTPNANPTPIPIDPNYLLQPDDVIEVTVFREPDLTTNAIVRKDGRFEMSLLGPVKVSGLTVDQATEAIRAGLAKDYLVSPRVSLGIVSYAKKKVNVLGEVRTPGLYSYPEHGALMLNDAIAMAGGLLPTADAAHVTVRREVGDRSEVTEVDASGGGDGRANTYEVEPDDAITVAVLAKRHFTVLGQINRPGDYDVADNRPIYLTDAIALAGGFTRLANPTHVLLKRSENGRETVLVVNARAMSSSAGTERLRIQNEDTITVPESMF
jgi:polysaccharide export outer membrane protein